MTDHPLSKVFSEKDFERLAQDKCLLNSGTADYNIAGMLSREPWDFEYAVGAWYDFVCTLGAGAAEEYRHRLRTDVGSRPRFLQTAGEMAAAHYLGTQLHVPVQRVAEQQGQSTPDFEVLTSSGSLLAEVKTIVGGIPVGTFGAFAAESRSPKVRKAVKTAARQLPASSGGLIFIVDFHRPPIPRDQVIEALYGTTILTLDYGRDGPVGDWQWTRKNDGFARQHRRVSAVGILGWSGEVACKAYFAHNVFARSPVPPEQLDPSPQFVLSADRTYLECRNRPDYWTT